MNTLIWLLLLGLLFVGCTQTSIPPVAEPAEEPPVPPPAPTIRAQAGDRVQVDYIGTLDNGTIFDTNLPEVATGANLPFRPYQPLEFVVGSGAMIRGFDQGVIGMAEGEEKTVSMPPGDAYGEVDPDLILSVNRSQLGGDNDAVFVGGQVQASNGMVGTITDVINGTLTIDFNHRLAGKNLTFQIFLRRISRS